MKYIKKFENLNYNEKSILHIKFSDLVQIDAIKSDKHPDINLYGKYDPNNEYSYFSTVKSIFIYINNKLVGELIIDERGFNTLRKSNKDKNPSDVVENAVIQVSNYLIECHKEMKLSNPLYGTYKEDLIHLGKKGNIPLLTHHFFDYVENDFNNSKKSKNLKIMLKNLPLKLEGEKYNL